jgi:demethylmenaquinone methyltransferase/2-methoxy-6-polyprenyl-1,4-benzoquinol methylase
MTTEMTRYYAERAAEYDRIYDIPGWQDGLAELRRQIAARFAGRRVLEVACGTGHWTQELARVAASVHGSDVNDETLALARARPWPRGNVTFERRDAYAPSASGRRFDAGFAGLWLSHVDLARMAEFLDAFHSHLVPGAVVLAFDERDRPRRPLAASRVDAAGNRYEMRTLANGTRFEIVKNFLEEARLRALLGPRATGFTYSALGAFWAAGWEVAA